MASALTVREVESARPKDTAYRLHDARVPGLSLRVLPSGVKSWSVTWARNRESAIGKYPIVTVEAARTKARALLAEVDQHGAPLAVIAAENPNDGRVLTVADVCRDYTADIEESGRKRCATDSRKRFDRIVYADPIGEIRADKLTQRDLEAWMARMKAGEMAGRKKGIPGKATLNRNLTSFKAALNRAVSRREIPQDRAIEWAAIKPYEGDDAHGRRERYLDKSQRRALLDAMEPDMRDMAECVALTGCRPGDPAAMLRKDWDSRHGLATFRTKTGARKVTVSPAAHALLDRLAKSKLPGARMFTNAGEDWTAQRWAEQVKDAATKAELPDDVVLYTLRHCWITDAIVGGMDLLTVSRLTGTSLEMISEHYGHLAQDAARDKLAVIQFV